ncbi:MAG: membrane protein insertion efficiency factor YidD [Crocinitomicaceae bacterium]|nr:membrane protein insertion efficiency factor YidD [Crocinitomicaceae bacterium]
MLKKIFIFPVKIYQWIISPLLPPSCRHEPTCSNYTIQAINEWGPFKGIWLGMKRLSKCHPWGTRGYDPVPENPKRKKKCDGGCEH